MCAYNHALYCFLFPLQKSGAAVLYTVTKSLCSWLTVWGVHLRMDENIVYIFPFLQKFWLKAMRTRVPLLHRINVPCYASAFLQFWSQNKEEMEETRLCAPITFATVYSGNWGHFSDISVTWTYPMKIFWETHTPWVFRLSY